MGAFGRFETDPAAARIRQAAGRGVLSHAILFTGGGALEDAARYAAAAMECTAPGNRPCGVCQNCRKVLLGIHPDVITVRDERHKSIAMDVVRSVRSDAWIRPNEGARKVYVFPDCGLLPEGDQNVLLKVVEEGPPYAAFLFCAENAAVVLPTLRSRCVELKPRAAEEKRSETPPDAEALCRAFTLRRGAVTKLAVGLERRKISREELGETLSWCREALSAALCLAYGREAPEEFREIAPFLTKNLTKGQIMSTIELLQKYAGDCVRPVGPGHVLGALAAEWEDIFERSDQRPLSERE